MNRTIARIILYSMAGTAVLWTSTLTYAFLSAALPDLTLAPVFGLVIFDAGMIAWLIAYLHVAEGSGQRSAALIGTVLDFIGVGLMALAEIWTGGQTFAAAPVQLAEYALWAVGGWTIANVGLLLYFHLTAPSARRDMAIREAQDNITDQAFEQLKAKTAEIAAAVAAQLSATMIADAIRQLTGAPSGTLTTPPAPEAQAAPAMRITTMAASETNGAHPVPAVTPATNGATDPNASGRRAKPAAK